MTAQVFDLHVVQLHYVPACKRRRDASNLVPTQKPAVDGLVDAGVVKDDTAEWVGELMPVIHAPDSGPACMWLAVSVGVSRSDAAAIAADVRHERTEDAATREEADG